MQDGVIDEVPVRAFAMTAERFAVVAGDDQNRLLIQSGVLQPRHEAADLLIGKRDLAIVETRQTAAAELGEQRFRRLVGAVRVVQMNPGEEGAILAPLQPRERGIHHLIAAPLDAREIEVLELLEIELVVVEAESPD